MKHSFYANEKNARSVSRTYGDYRPRGSGSYRGSKIPEPHNLDKKIDDYILSLSTEVKAKYRNDPEALSEIRGKLEMFAINLGIARECKSRASEKKLKNEIIKYLREKR